MKRTTTSWNKPILVAVVMMPESVCRQIVTVNLRDGLHLRPISQFARLAMQFDCDVTLHHDPVTANGKSQLELMTLNANFGANLVLEASGDDAVEAVESLVRLFESNFEVDESSSA